MIIILSTIIISIVLLIYKVFKRLYYYKLAYNTDKRAIGCLKETTKLINDMNPIPLENQDKKILEHTLKEFIIAASHNTYLPCYQNIDIANKLAIRNALLLGSRVIELDLFINKKNSEPIILHGSEGKTIKSDIYTTSAINFEEACIEINNTAFKKTTDPLIITLELNTHKNVDTNNKIAFILKKIFGDKLLKQDKTRLIGDYKLKELIGKVIILSGGGVSGELENVINNTWYDSKLKNISSSTKITDELIKFNNSGITRVYPSGNFWGHLSKNYNPKKYWNAGCQIVALNYQTNDYWLRKNNKIFKDSSFILKNGKKF